MDIDIPKLQDTDLTEKKVLLRADLDIDESREGMFRLEALLPTLKYLSEKKCEITIIGHRDRPGGIVKPELSLKTVNNLLRKLMEERWGEESKNIKMTMLENLRFYSSEEGNDIRFAENLAKDRDFYINDAFAASHREHASIVSLPKLLPHAAGLRFIEEINNLSKTKSESVERPLVVIMGGVKPDKIEYLDGFRRLADLILLAGRIPEQISDFSEDRVNLQLVIAHLLPDKEDITINSIEKFEEEIKKAKTIVLAGPIGKFEDEGHQMGTKRVFEAVAKSSAYKIAGGGETIEAIEKFKLEKQFNWISVGGGAMLEFLTKGTLPGIEALLV